MNFNKHKIIRYILDKQLSDGGFYFAQIEPSSEYDTYCATKTLDILGSAPHNINAVLEFWENSFEEGEINDIDGLFFATESLSVLFPKDNLVKELKKHFETLHGDFLKTLFHKKTFNFQDDETFGSTHESTTTVYTEFVERELLELYYFVILSQKFGISLQRGKIKDFLFSLQNHDGGYGSLNGSQIPTTYYALAILELLKINFPNGNKTSEFILKKSKRVQYLEDLYWLTQSQKLLKTNAFGYAYIEAFLLDCWNDDGGFRRSRDMGISNLEWTMFAVIILKQFNLVGN
jgi:hypothetical protein